MGQTQRDSALNRPRRRHPPATDRPRRRTQGTEGALFRRIQVGVLGLFLACWGLSAEEAKPPTQRFPWSSPQALKDGIVTFPHWSPHLKTPPSIVAQDVLRNILARSIQQPGTGATMLAPWQQSIVDQSNGEPLNFQSYERLLRRRQQVESAALRSSPSGVPQVSNAELREVRVLPGLTCVLEVQRFVMDELTRLEPDGWLHVAALYAQTYRQQTFPAPAFWLRDHTAQEAVAAAQAHYDASGEVDLFIAQLLTLVEVHSHLMVYFDGMEARKLLDRVLELDSEHLVALYWAGYLAEKFGDYRPAQRHYGAYLQVQGDDPEVRLRFLVNRLRVVAADSSDAHAAWAGLERLARSDAVTDWIRQVAWYEWVRGVGAVDAGKAVDLLTQALSVFPDDPGLHLQLAFYLRQPEWQQALSSLELAADLGPLGLEPGGRVLYERPRRQGLEQNRAWLEAQLASRRGRLEAALDTLRVQWRREPPSVRTVQHPCGDSIRAMYTLREENP